MRIIKCKYAYRIFLRLKKHKVFLISSCTLALGLNYVVNHVYYNPSRSEALGYYWISSHSSLYQVGDKVLICLNQESVIARVHKLGLPYSKGECLAHTPYLLKTIVASYPDKVAINRNGIYINNRLFTKNSGYNDFRGTRLFPILNLNESLKPKEYFVIGNTDTSYDSRYFGTIKESQIRAKAYFIILLK